MTWLGITKSEKTVPGPRNQALADIFFRLVPVFSFVRRSNVTKFQTWPKPSPYWQEGSRGCRATARGPQATGGRGAACPAAQEPLEGGGRDAWWCSAGHGFGAGHCVRDTKCPHWGSFRPLGVWNFLVLGMPGGSAKRGRRPKAGGAGGAKPQEAAR